MENLSDNVMLTHCTDHARNEICYAEISFNKVSTVVLQETPKLLEYNKPNLSQMEQKINEIAELNPHMVSLVESTLVIHMLQFLNWSWYFFVGESKNALLKE